jgi:hypothetical protein
MMFKGKTEEAFNLMHIIIDKNRNCRNIVFFLWISEILVDKIHIICEF